MNNAFVNLLLRGLILALGVMLSTKLVAGITYDSGATLLAVVLVLTFFNAVLKPILLLFALPFILLTLGIGTWVINACLFYFAGRVVEGFRVDSFSSALWGALIVSLTSLILNRLMAPGQPPRPPPSNPANQDDVIDI